METHYAKATRSQFEDILKDYHFIKSNIDVTALLDAIPSFVMILDENRQIVYLNNSLHKFLNVDINESLGKRPGELINCIYSAEMKWGCGTSTHCKFCGAVNSILESQTTDKMIIKECCIVSSDGDSWTSNEFSVSSSKFKIRENLYTFFSLIDISDKKRRVALEKIFFHDIINSAGSLVGVIDILQENEVNDERKHLLNLASSVSHELIEEVLSQRQILSAENNELLVDLTSCNSLRILKSVAERMAHHSTASGKKITVDKNSKDFEFISDEKILKRILINMVKNALEAIVSGDEVRLSVDLIEGRIIFSTDNPGYISNDIQLQIFQRSFSTKGTNRGLGTYSMKLLTEKYLKGKVYFTSQRDSGTAFYCEIPLVKDKR